MAFFLRLDAIDELEDLLLALTDDACASLDLALAPPCSPSGLDLRAACSWRATLPLSSVLSCMSSSRRKLLGVRQRLRSPRPTMASSLARSFFLTCKLFRQGLQRQVVLLQPAS
jgi:hypothetical protein